MSVTIAVSRKYKSVNKLRIGFRVELVVQFPASGSTQVLLCLFPGLLWLWQFLYSVGPHPVSGLHIYTFVVSRAFMAVRLAKQETLTPPGHLVSPLVCRGPWMSTVVLYCWCHSDSASVLLYFTFVFVGIGIATIVVDFLMNSYYIIILAWSAFYFVQCFSSVLPWATCENAWNTDRYTS